MRRLSLLPTGESVRNERGESIPYPVAATLAGLVTGPHLRLNARGIIAHGKVADKIDDSAAAGSDHVLLEEAEYQLLRAALDGFAGYSREDIPLIERVLDGTPEVPLSILDIKGDGQSTP